MKKFWNSYCVEPWNNWSMTYDTMLCMPNNNPQEAWHRNLLRSKIPGMFRGSTEHVFSVALPQLIQLEGLLRPDMLTFHVPLIYPEMMAKVKSKSNLQ